MNTLKFQNQTAFLFTIILLLLITGCNSSQKKAKDCLYNGIDKHNKGDFKGAIADYNKAIEIDPNYGYAYFIRGDGEIPGDYNGALRDLNKAIEISPKDTSTLRLAYATRGYVKDHFGDYDGRCADWKMAFQLGNKAIAESINRNCK